MPPPPVRCEPGACAACDAWASAQQHSQGAGYAQQLGPHTQGAGYAHVSSFADKQPCAQTGFQVPVCRRSPPTEWSPARAVQPHQVYHHGAPIAHLLRVAPGTSQSRHDVPAPAPFLQEFDGTRARSQWSSVDVHTDPDLDHGLVAHPALTPRYEGQPMGDSKTGHVGIAVWRDTRSLSEDLGVSINMTSAPSAGAVSGVASERAGHVAAEDWMRVQVSPLSKTSQFADPASLLTTSGGLPVQASNLSAVEPSMPSPGRLQWLQAERDALEAWLGSSSAAWEVLERRTAALQARRERDLAALEARTQDLHCHEGLFTRDLVLDRSPEQARAAEAAAEEAAQARDHEAGLRLQEAASRRFLEGPSSGASWSASSSRGPARQRSLDETVVAADEELVAVDPRSLRQVNQIHTRPLELDLKESIGRSSRSSSNASSGSDVASSTMVDLLDPGGPFTFTGRTSGSTQAGSAPRASVNLFALEHSSTHRVETRSRWSNPAIPVLD